ncbi:hypothetical protein QBC38DRAFT_528049 [Podospora fimiseda]|uniref:Carrier domain-containing protein n=1 Tax=Podospora fimiseda TaxID=252190 RepID=A0AAN7GXW1_9PEZI|nr:hypothetical protein QBC38DRAFT_528049 [Podospora fimiseda]
MAKLLFAPEYVIHPATLDGLAQIVVPALSKHKIWVDANIHGLNDAVQISVHAQTRMRNRRGASADIIGTVGKSNLPLLYLPDLELMDPSQVLDYCVCDRPPQAADEVEAYQSLVLAIMCFIEEGLEFVEENKNLMLEPHLKAFVEWMTWQQQRLGDGELQSIDRLAVRRHLDDTVAREALIEEVQSRRIDGFFFMEIGRNLIRVLRGEVDPLELIFHDGLAGRYYEEMLANDHHAHPATAWLNLLCFKNPSMKILEVGAGTGGQTLRLLEEMSSDGVMKWDRYDYTDISQSFFDQARHKFESYLSRMRFKVCDISKDPTIQSFEPGTYDLIVASHVLHATDRLDDSLRHILKLLKPAPEAILAFAFGLLKGWWSPLDHEERNHHSPSLAAEQWHERLRQTGFPGVGVDIPGQERIEMRYSSIIISTAVDVSSNGAAFQPKDVNLVIDENSPAQTAMAGLIKEKLDVDCNITTLAQLAAQTATEDCLILWLLEADSMFLYNISETDYSNLKPLLVQYQSILWVTKGQSGPQHALADGLDRVLMSEDANRKFVTVSFDGLSKMPQQVDLISKLAHKILESPVEGTETKYRAAEDGTVQVCRVYENSFMDAVVSKGTVSHKTVEIELGSEICVSLQPLVPGHHDKLGSELGVDEILVAVKAIGLTGRDMSLVTGELIEENDDNSGGALGSEFAGTVLLAGAESGFSKGDPVCFLLPLKTVPASLMRVKAHDVAALPPDLSFTEAVSIMHSAWTAYHAIVNVARVRQGDTMLILRAAATPEGELVVQIARILGATILSTSNSPVERQILSEKLGIPDKLILDINGQGTLASQVTSATGDAGVDVVALSGMMNEQERRYQELLAPMGRLIHVVGSPDVSSDQTSFGKKLNVSRTTIDMLQLQRTAPCHAIETFQQAREFFFKNRNDMQLLPSFQIVGASDAPRVIQQATTKIAKEKAKMNKLVISLQQGKTIQAQVKTKPRYSFPPDGPYVIAGGLAQSKRAKNLVDELMGQGVRVETPRVNIGNLEQLQIVLKDLASSGLPPVRGCIQASVVLRDNLFPNMTYEDWAISTQAKVSGSWNLHTALPQDLDFFDALAEHRLSLGQKAVAIDLGLMVGEGIVAENADLLASMRRLGHLMDIQSDELLVIMDYYCDPKLPCLRPEEAQILVGLEMPSAVLAKGIGLHHAIHRPMFRHLFQMGSSSPGDNERKSRVAVNQQDLGTMLAEAETQAEATVLVGKWFAGKVAHILGLSEEDIDLRRSVHTYGIDSLVAIDLKNWFAREVGTSVEVFTLPGNVEMGKIAEDVARGKKLTEISMSQAGLRPPFPISPTCYRGRIFAAHLGLTVEKNE